MHTMKRSKSGSHLTRRWRGLDSNPRSPSREFAADRVERWPIEQSTPEARLYSDADLDKTGDAGELRPARLSRGDGGPNAVFPTLNG